MDSSLISPDIFRNCNLCPRQCMINRESSVGFCGCSPRLMAARAALHYWEEPCISGIRGSGAVFFTGCTLGCCFCQNHSISQKHLGKELTSQHLADIFLRLQGEGAHNINLVTATQYLPLVLTALDLVRHRLTIPVVYNCGGYERVEIVQALKDYVDIWLPDLKYHDSSLSRKYSKASDYFAVASQAIIQMISQTGKPVFHRESKTTDPIMDRGVIVRHMVLPGHKDDSIRLLQWMACHLPKGEYYVSLLSQYTPIDKNCSFPELNRPVTSYEYQKVWDTALSLGLDQGFMQKKSSARQEYTPAFDFSGL
ncbi:MAG: radical SAM protein [Lachnospiraceae bacterium]|jgi:putative pyruvate formate lyase activating enzyme|nr:radical SAM protein [Lachnospiraceae bacterium]